MSSRTCMSAPEHHHFSSHILCFAPTKADHHGRPCETASDRLPPGMPALVASCDAVAATDASLADAGQGLEDEGRFIAKRFARRRGTLLFSFTKPGRAKMTRSEHDGLGQTITASSRPLKRRHTTKTAAGRKLTPTSPATRAEHFTKSHKANTTLLAKVRTASTGRARGWRVPPGGSERRAARRSASSAAKVFQKSTSTDLRAEIADSEHRTIISPTHPRPEAAIDAKTSARRHGQKSPHR